MKYNPAKHHRRSIRLPHYDYTSPGAYFVTICTYQHECLFGEVFGGEMLLNHFGQLAQSRWQVIPRYFSSANLDNFVVMPNHIHGIVMISDDVRRSDAFGEKLIEVSDDQQPNASPLLPNNGTQAGSLDAIIQNFKSISTRRINSIQRVPGGKVWQRGYYDRIIRNRASLQRIRQYIQNNPKSWGLDQLHPDNLAKE